MYIIIAAVLLATAFLYHCHTVVNETEERDGNH
jgi:hypothetical protein